MMKQITKLPAAMGLLALMFFAAPQAEALEQVCMRANVGIGYVFQFRVAWGVDGRAFPGAAREGRPFNIDGVTPWSGDTYLGHNRCANVRRIPNGSTVLVQLRENGNWTYCRNWDNNDWGLATAHGNRRTLWLDAWGQSRGANCKLWKFE